MVKNQIFITTGFQLLNALEYLHATKKNNDSIEVIAIHSYANSLRGINEMAKMYDCDKVVYFFPQWIINLQNKFLKQILMNFWTSLRLQSTLDKSATIILGSYHNFICQVVSKKTSNDNMILVDDGASSIGYPTYCVSRSRIIERVFGLSKNKIIPRFFFTAYSDILAGKIESETTLLENNYKLLKSANSLKQTGSTVYFVGAPLVEDNFLEKREYIDIIKAVYEKRKFIYIPHPRESKENLEAVKEISEVLSLDFPFELLLISKKELPGCIIGYHSSIFFNVHRLFDGKIKTYYIKLKNIQKHDFEDRLLNIYRQLDLVASELKI